MIKRAKGSRSEQIKATKWPLFASGLKIVSFFNIGGLTGLVSIKAAIEHSNRYLLICHTKLDHEKQDKTF